MGLVGLGASIEGTIFVVFLLEQHVLEVLGLTGGSNILCVVTALRFAHFDFHHCKELTKLFAFLALLFAGSLVASFLGNVVATIWALVLD